MFDRLRDWLRELGRRRPTSPPVSGLSTDYDFQILLQTEWAAISGNMRMFRKIAKDGYITLGGNMENAKKIVTKVICTRIEYKLRQQDLPGPDEYIIPKVLEFAGEFIGKSFDEFFTDDPNVPFIGSND